MKNIHLAEETCPTIKYLLAGENTRDFSSVSFYAQKDYEAYLFIHKLPMYTIAQKEADYDIDEISVTLNKMAVPCKCDNKKL